MDDAAELRITRTSDAVLVLHLSGRWTLEGRPPPASRVFEEGGEDVRAIRFEADGVTVVQNPDPLYWKLVAEGRRLDRPIRIDEQTFAVFHLSHWRSTRPTGRCSSVGPTTFPPTRRSI